MKFKLNWNFNFLEKWKGKFDKDTIRHYLHYLVPVKKAASKQGIVGINLTRHGIAIAHVVCHEHEKPDIKHYTYQASSDDAEKAKILKDFVESNELQEYPAAYVLHRKDYSLNLVEAPQVEEDELGQAVRWIVKDMIDFPIDQAVVDAFTLPLERASDNKKLAYAAVMQEKTVDQIEEVVNASGLKLHYIDIPELAYRNLASLYPDEKKGVLLIRAYRNGGQLLLCRDKQVYIARTMELQMQELLDPTEGDEELAAEEAAQAAEVAQKEVEQETESNNEEAPTKSVEDNVSMQADEATETESTAASSGGLKFELEEFEEEPPAPEFTAEPAEEASASQEDLHESMYTVLDDLTLEVQRSMDYCTSMFRQAPAQILLMLPSELKMKQITGFLKDHVGMPVDQLDLNNALKVEDGKMRKVDQFECLLAIGAALREITSMGHMH